MKTCIDCGWPLPCDCEPERSAGSQERVVRGIIVEWENEADLLKSGNHPRRQNVPRTQVLQEECALRGCIADIKRVLDASNSEIRQAGPETHDKQQQRNPALPASNG